MLSTLLIGWAIVSAAACVWPFILYMCGIEQPGLLVVIAPVFLPFFAVLIPILLVFDFPRMTRLPDFSLA